MTCEICGIEDDLDEGVCEDCAAEGWADDPDIRPVHDIQVIGGVL